MKKQIILAATLLMTAVALNAQVGVGTDTPKATLEIVGETTATVPDGVLVPRFTAAELTAKNSAYGADQNGTMVFVESGTGSAGKTVDITGAGFYYYDGVTDNKWKALGSGSTSATTFNVTAEITSSYTVLANDGFVKVNVNAPGAVLTLPTTGISVGKIVYVSHIGTMGMDVLPAPRNSSFTTVPAGTSGAFVYLGGSGAGSWDWVAGY